jgi:hypothetical protein
VLLLEVYVQFVEFVGLLFWHVPQPEFHDLPCSFVLVLLYLKLAEVDEVSLIHGLRPKIDDNLLINLSCSFLVSVFELKFGYFQVSLKGGVCLKILVQDILGPLGLSHSFLKFDVGHPGFFPWSPFHPPPEDISGLFEIAEDFFHVCILEPELVFPGQIMHSSFPDVSGVIDELVFHFHFCVLEP